MEDPSEKMEALKKAYAEIILNTAKEAAARTMASERKALRFHYDLQNTKDEALRMLLRFKQMIDVKTTEAETTALSQQKRIEELDAQLNEAEGVIVDLRAEISKAHERLEEVKNSRMIQSNEPPSENKHVNHENTSQSHDKNYDVTALYRNGYTHRIRATERNLVPQKELIIDVDETSFGKCAPTSIVTENADTKNINGSEVVSVNRVVANGQTVKSQRFSRSSGVATRKTVTGRRLPRRSVRYAQSNGKLSRFYHGSSTNRATELEKVSLTVKNENGDSTLRRSVRKRKVRCWEDMSSLFKSRATLSRCKKYSGDVSKDDELPDVSKDDELPEDTNLINVPVVEKHEIPAKELDGVAHDTDANKLMRYTFSRRSKKAISSKSDHSFENEKPDLIEDPSGESQNMVDVACQLISLSGDIAIDTVHCFKTSSASKGERLVQA